MRPDRHKIQERISNDKKELMDINKFRASMKMRPLEFIERTCLRCGKTFSTTAGMQKRICCGGTLEY